MTFMSEFKKITKEIQESWPLVLGTVYVAGFIVWNRFLSNFGLFEFNLLQTKFISAGIWAVLSFYLLYVWKLHTARKSFAIVIFLIYIFSVFPLIVFPLIPSSYGGGMPILTSLIGTSDQIKYFDENFEIPKEKNKNNLLSVQTQPICLFFEREDRMVVGSISASTLRVVTLRGDRFIGFSQPPGGFGGVYACLVNYFQPEWLYHSYGWFLKRAGYLAGI